MKHPNILYNIFASFLIIQSLLGLYSIWTYLANIEPSWWFVIGIYFGGIFVTIGNYLIFEVFTDDE